jgi:hypothetical protein
MNCARSIAAVLFALSICRVLSGQAPLAKDVPKVFVGFLDDAREEMANWEPGVPRDRFVRPAFEKVGSGWRLVNAWSLPARMTWTIAFDGKSLGKVKSEAWEIGDRITQGRMDQGFRTIVQAIMTPMVAVPSVGPPSNHFAGLMASGPGKVRRPLVLVSKPYFGDPDGWKRLPQPPDRIANLVDRFLDNIAIRFILV